MIQTRRTAGLCPGPLRTSRRSLVVAVVLTTCTGLAAIAIPRAAGAATGTVTAAAVADGSIAPVCGTASYTKSNGQKWVCSFDDEFKGSRLDATNWTAVTSMPGGFKGGGECYTPANVNLGNGMLTLKTTRTMSPFTCVDHPTRYRSGMIASRDTFSQTYGRFEIRAKIPMSKGLHSAFWMLPVDPYHSGALDYGEIDVMEAAGAYKNIASPQLHFVTTPNLTGGEYCTVANIATQWHTYALEWTSTSMRFVYDDTTCWTTTWQPVAGYQPAGAKPPTPFDQPFYIILNMGTDNAETIPANAVSGSTSLTAGFAIDYVRVWK